MDQDSTFMSSLMTYLLNKLNFKIKTVAPYNHQSLQAEHGIKSLSNILTKHLTNLGQMWQKYLSLATFAYNIFNTPYLRNHSMNLYLVEKHGLCSIWIQLLISRSQAVSKNIMTY